MNFQGKHSLNSFFESESSISGYLLNISWENIIYSQTARRLKFYFAFVLFLMARIYEVLFSLNENVKLVMNKPFWSQIAAFWRATQLGRKFVFSLSSWIWYVKSRYSLRSLCKPTESTQCLKWTLNTTVTTVFCYRFGVIFKNAVNFGGVTFGGAVTFGI